MQMYSLFLKLANFAQEIYYIKQSFKISLDIDSNFEGINNETKISDYA